MLVCLIGTATIAVTGMVARDLVTPRAGVIAAVIAALYPGFWVFDGEIMSEALVMLLAALTILAANRCFRRFSTGRIVVLGLLTGLCALTRAELVLLDPAGGPAHRSVAAVPGLSPSDRPVRPGRGRGRGPDAALVRPQHRRLPPPGLPLRPAALPPLAAANNAQTYSGPLTASWCYTCLLDARFPLTDDESDRRRLLAEARPRRYIKAHKVRALEVAVERVGPRVGPLRAPAGRRPELPRGLADPGVGRLAVLVLPVDGPGRGGRGRSCGDGTGRSTR